MSIEVVNDFILALAKKIFWIASFRGNMSFNGLTAYLLLAIISIGVDNNAKDQLIEILKQNFDVLSNISLWHDSHIAELFLVLRDELLTEFTVYNLVFHGCKVRKNFKDMAKETLNIRFDRINSTKFKRATSILNHRVQQYVENLHQDIFVGRWNFKQPLLVFVNVASFNKYWHVPVRKVNTRREVFFRSSIRKHTVFMMSMIGLFRFTTREGFDVAFLNYDESEIVAAVIVPTDFTDVAELFNRFKYHDLQTLYNESEPRRMLIKLPKFNMFINIGLRDTLMNMEIKEIFQNQTQNINRISKDASFIDQIFQVSMISIDEEGTWSNPIVTQPPVFSEGPTINEEVSIVANIPFIFILFHPGLKFICSMTVVKYPNVAPR
ncbi:Glia-derived nexin [Thelohanellus kitauei]|uniref:Glia-derived nexin n=1 Tax=Thelohanellus kitauei TaxID=669202 RepID=A0A0C2M5S1_THEKT|nr:Glia-derived nexin [Thelohanellus kitauei]